ncbi:DUF7882 family protein [Agromyces ramosus]|uniref:DUF7882 domain-containing protein n=1 Tax=Agromyces ramosus TaxID=33879 RepID=A0ABU0R756_9MICO|nr:ATP-dependent DNA ligase [Agromyces ramosus]MDQ0893905.1 hypothetical protein [Agromyces ramosus]
MGTLNYDSRITVELDDRTLAHLQLVIWSKLRRGEHFSFTWTVESATPRRTSVWCAPNIPMVFEYDQSEPAELNPRWMELLTKSANSGAGLRLLPEPEPGS